MSAPGTTNRFTKQLDSRRAIELGKTLSKGRSFVRVTDQIMHQMHHSWAVGNRNSCGTYWFSRDLMRLSSGYYEVMQAMSLLRILKLITLLHVDTTQSAVILGRASFALNFNWTPGLVKAYLILTNEISALCLLARNSSLIHPYWFV